MKPWLACFCLLFTVQTFAEDAADLKIADKTRVAAMRSSQMICVTRTPTASWTPRSHS
jgi:hypothetical protein